MEFDLWWLLALPLMFALGWLASRVDLRQLGAERALRRDAPQAYYRGLNHLLNEQQDKAIDAFIEAMTADPDTVDLHFALGNLFRRRGEYERAVRVHQNLLARADLPRESRERAQLALAQDFFKAGLLDRAESAYEDLLRSPHASQALSALLQISERTQDWNKAIERAGELEKRATGTYQRQIAQYWCELAVQHQAAGRTDSAQQALDAALAASPQGVRPRLLRAQWAQERGDLNLALQTLQSIDAVQPEFLALAAVRIAQIQLQLGQVAEGLAWLRQRLAQTPAVDLLDAVLLLDPDPASRGQCAQQYLQAHRSLLALKRVLENPAPGATVPEAAAAMQGAVDNALRSRQRYRCAACGFEARQYFWHCPGCQGWETYPPRRLEELSLLGS
ncbi:lipopolysaccharide regulatory protein [mine drainage metagenome]|uniref:Lipopolysaccharide regulatory protein n=1 Tax=mine drainage metagenome TaxID=410659 RepID=A0A1J5Q6M5_9ZZZZ